MIYIMTECVASKLGDSRRLLLLALAIFTVILTASGQVNAAQIGATAKPEETSAKMPVYDVFSIKPNKSGSGSLDVDADLDNYSATNISLKRLMQDAYGIKEDQIFGVPGPVDSARFDVQAKSVEFDPDALKKLTGKQRRAMLLPLLVERFQLKTHTEIKILPVYELVVTHGGPKFSQSADDSKHGASLNIHNTELTAQDLPMASLARALSDQVHRTVIDKTGLAGNYDLTLKWSLEDNPSAETDAAPSIFTALQEQLGLKLHPAKGPVETLVVDHAEIPSKD
jgi:uncharacterized protein (TIGR03435 family)